MVRETQVLLVNRVEVAGCKALFVWLAWVARRVPQRVDWVTVLCGAPICVSASQHVSIVYLGLVRRHISDRLFYCGLAGGGDPRGRSSGVALYTATYQSPLILVRSPAVILRTLDCCRFCITYSVALETCSFHHTKTRQIKAIQEKESPLARVACQTAHAFI